MYLPHDVFRLILSFKDPTRQVGVKGGIKTDSARAMPIERGAETRRLNAQLNWDRILVEGKLYFVRLQSMGWIEHTHYFIFRGKRATSREGEDIEGQGGSELIKEFKLTSNDRRPPASELWLQCEACGPDLFVHKPHDNPLRPNK